MMIEVTCVEDYVDYPLYAEIILTRKRVERIIALNKVMVGASAVEISTWDNNPE